MTRDPMTGSARANSFGLAAILVCAAVGIILATIPHLAAWHQTGSLAYVTDNDDTLYLAIARAPYWGEWALRDPFAAMRDHVPTPFAPALFIPFAKLTGWIGLPPLLIAMVWRIAGGAMLGVAVYVLVRRSLAATEWNGRLPVLACTVSVILLADAGFIPGQPLLGTLKMLRSLLSTAPLSAQTLIGQYRVVTPVLDLPWLLLLMAALIPSGPSTAAFSRLRWVAGTLCFAACIYTYFYYWTASGLAMSLIIIGRLIAARLDPEQSLKQWAEIKLVLAIAVSGLILGLPQILATARMAYQPQFAESLQRMARGLHIPADDPARFRYVMNTSALATLLVTAAVLVFHRRSRRLGRNIPTTIGVLGAFALAGYMLKNIGIGRIEFENFHWVTVHGAATSVIVATLAIAMAKRFSRALMTVSIAVALFVFATASRCRWAEVSRNPQTAHWTTVLAQLRPIAPQLSALGPDDVLAGPTEANIALLFGRAGELFMWPYTVHGSLVDNREVHERHALSAWLMGESDQQYEIDSRPARPFALMDGPVPQWEPSAVAAVRLQIFRSVEADNGASLLARYRPNRLLLPAGVQPVRGGPWSLVASSTEWALWRSDVR